MISAALTQTRMLRLLNRRQRISKPFPFFHRNFFNLYFFSIGHPQRQFIPMDPELHRITHRRILNQRHDLPRNHTHVQKMLAQRALTSDTYNDRRFTNAQFI